MVYSLVFQGFFKSTANRIAFYFSTHKRVSQNFKNIILTVERLNATILTVKSLQRQDRERVIIVSDKTYHHGNLRNALIEAGIAYINENGISQFSLRKVAAQCGVSHTAPYSHFADKEDLLEAMKSYVSERFADALEDAANGNANQSKAGIVTDIGIKYVQFFYNNPQYYQFVFSRSGFDITLDTVDEPSDYRPFEIFRSAAIALLKENNCPQQMYQQTIFKMWSLVHGMAGISVMQGICFSGKWEELVRTVLESVELNRE